MPAAPGDGGRVDATLPPREWESWVDEAEGLWAAVSASKAARATTARRPAPPESGRAPRVDPDFAFASPAPPSRPWPAAKLFTTGGATDEWRPFSPFVAPPAAFAASPAASSPAMIQFSSDDQHHHHPPGGADADSEAPRSAAETEDDATSRARAPPNVSTPVHLPGSGYEPPPPTPTDDAVAAWWADGHRDTRACRRAFDAWRRSTLDARADELRLRASLADVLFTADARRFRSPEASAMRLWHSLRASDRRANRHSLSPDPTALTPRRYASASAAAADDAPVLDVAAAAEARNWMRAHAFAAFAGWRAVSTRDAAARAATVRFRATRATALASRLFSSWRVSSRRDRRARLGVSRMTRRRERRALVHAMLTWRTRVALAPSVADAVAHASRRWRRYRLLPSFRAWRDEGLLDAREFARRADARWFATCAGAATRRWRRFADHHARVRAWDAFATQWRARRVAANATRGWRDFSATMRDARVAARDAAERRRFRNLVLLFHAWRRRAAAIVAGTELVRLAWVKWNRERLETAFGAMRADAVLRRAEFADVADAADVRTLARATATWRSNAADERDARAPAMASMARCAAAWRARTAWREWRRAVIAARERRVAAATLATRSTLERVARRWRVWRSENETRRRATIRAAAPLTRRFVFRAWFERWAIGAAARRAARDVANARAAATRDASAKRRATHRWRHVAARRVFDRLQEARAVTFRIRALTRRWRAYAAWKMYRRDERARAEAHRFAVVVRAWRRRTAEIRVENEEKRRQFARVAFRKMALAWSAWREMTLEMRPVRRRLRRYAASMRAGHFESDRDTMRVTPARARRGARTRRGDDARERFDLSVLAPVVAPAARARATRLTKHAMRRPGYESTAVRLGGIWAAAAREKVFDAWFVAEPEPSEKDRDATEDEETFGRGGGFGGGDAFRDHRLEDRLERAFDGLDDTRASPLAGGMFGVSLAAESPPASPASRWSRRSSSGGASSAAFASARSSPGQGALGLGFGDTDRGDDDLDREPRRSSSTQPRGTRRPPPSSTASSPGFVSARSSPAHAPVYVPPRYAPPNGNGNGNGIGNGGGSVANGRPPTRAGVGASRSLDLDLHLERDVVAVRAPRFGSDVSPERPETGTGTGTGTGRPGDEHPGDATPGDEPSSPRGGVSGILDRLRRRAHAAGDGDAGVRVTWSPGGTPTGPSRETSARMLALRSRFE